VKGFFGVGHEGGVAFGLGQLDHAELVGKVVFDRLDGADLVVEARTFLEDFLGPLLVLPEGGIFSEGVQFGKPVDGAVPVKDASSAGRATP
jgi:hypothetical protein